MSKVQHVPSANLMRRNEAVFFVGTVEFGNMLVMEWFAFYSLAPYPFIFER